EDFDYSEDFDSYNYSGEIERKSFYNSISLEEMRMRRLATTFALIVSKIAEDYSIYENDGDDIWDIKRLMLRRFTKEPLSKCRLGLERERLILALDFSGSCIPQSRFFKRLSEIASKNKDIEVFDASNGFDLEDNYSITDNQSYKFDYFKNRIVIFFGDFDGGASLVRLSKIAKVYWFSCEDRYDDLCEHGWCCGYSLEDFKGKYYRCLDENDFIKLTKKIRS
ncbi:MAG: hypothetical protein N2606_04095, partial [Candidatus Omnitrophica bacterium]|nr:hypothetical protein [Candidatus Omnitrophota bacterium]